MKKILFIIFVILSACKSAPEPTEASPDVVEQKSAMTEEAPTPIAPIELSKLSGRYGGFYVCPQGKTGLRLDLEVAEDGSTTGIFSFEEHPENPGVPDGSFRVSGTTSADGKLVVGATEQDWIQQPEGYIVVGLVGQFENDEIDGTITNEECTTFYVKRGAQPNDF